MGHRPDRKARKARNRGAARRPALVQPVGSDLDELRLAADEAKARAATELLGMRCSGEHDDGIADGNLTACSRASGCGLSGCPYVSDYVRAAGFAVGRPYKMPGKPPQKTKAAPRGAHAFEACKDGSLVIYATMPDGDGEPIRIEPHRVMAVLCACGDALAKKPSTR